MSAQDLAAVVVAGMEFCLGFRVSDDGVMLAMAIKEPSRLHPNDAEEIYFRLEEILQTGQRQNQVGLTRARERMGAVFAADLARRVSVNDVALRLLMTRVARVFDRSLDERVRQMEQRLFGALKYIDQAVADLKVAKSALGEVQIEEHWEFLRNSAYVYASSYSS